MSAGDPAAPALVVSGVSKSYPGVRALRDVSFQIARGQVHALVGENGAGKSTLIRILSGVEAPDAGTITSWSGADRPTTPVEALRQGISTLYQEQNLLPDRTVVENLLLGATPRRLGVFLDVAAARDVTRTALHRVGAGHIDPGAVVGGLSLADRQMVDIARAVHRNCRLLIMDEPTAALSSREVDALFAIVAGLADDGVSVLFVSHRLDEIFRIARAVTVLRDGRHVLTAPIGELTPDDLVDAMVGEAARAALPPRAPRPRTGETPAVRLRGASGPGFHDVDLSVHSGEIVALAGVTGSGKEDVGMALLGAAPVLRGAIEIRGRAIRLTPRRAIAAGVVGVPADRAREGVIGPLSVRRNLSLPSLRTVSRLGFLDRSRERALAGHQIRELAVKAADPSVAVGTLSGGNQQKVAIGKWLELRPQVLVLIEPTQGIDIRVRFEIYRLLFRLADAGTAVVLVSSDVPEVLTLADRVVVLRAGTVTGELPAASATAESLLRMSLGRRPRDTAPLRTTDRAVNRTGGPQP
ncbi:sugar ABC transporter ATP-binding protein [Nakamurella endophytica]|uniref:Ribose import ATP-binding protein RbsA n=1 Tax=Nakamurella endophytica TaxID=1748367 RepID=A0A917WNX4_9ACTN|nr:sugar ABC transporter ATP-binding protein [Nakamurella endophytica]GGM17520.1 ribose import ATP-binding protein RbsA [Nakamurella endophytica]